MEDNKKQANRISLHKFDSWSLELMNKPYKFDKWACGQVGENNEGVYREGYQNLPVKDNGEELVSCSDYGLVSKDYYLNVFLDEVKQKSDLLMPLLQNKQLFPFAWVRQTVAQRLMKVDMFLRSHDLLLVVNSGWRGDEVFTVHPGEFWHFGDGDPLSAYLKRFEYAKYGYIRPNANYKFHGNE